MEKVKTRGSLRFFFVSADEPDASCSGDAGKDALQSEVTASVRVDLIDGEALATHVMKLGLPITFDGLNFYGRNAITL